MEQKREWDLLFNTCENKMLDFLLIAPQSWVFAAGTMGAKRGCPTFQTCEYINNE